MKWEKLRKVQGCVYDLGGGDGFLNVHLLPDSCICVTQAQLFNVNLIPQSSSLKLERGLGPLGEKFRNGKGGTTQVQ